MRSALEAEPIADGSGALPFGGQVRAEREVANVMRKRLIGYLIAFLLAVIASIIPSAIYADFITPFNLWEDEMHPHPITVSNLPQALRVEMFVFETLVVPPGWLATKLSGYPTVYSAPYISKVNYETDTVPPLRTALNHLRWALPFWFVAFVVVFETANVLVGRRRRVT